MDAPPSYVEKSEGPVDSIAGPTNAGYNQTSDVQHPGQPPYNQGYPGQPPSYAPGYNVQQPYYPGYNNQPVSVTNQAPQVVVIQQSVASSLYDNYLSSHSLGLGIVMIICGILSIVFNIVMLAMLLPGGYAGHGFWGNGVWLILAGSFGIAAARSKTKCVVITFMVLSIITAVACGICLILASLWAAVFSPDDYSYSYNCRRHYGYSNGYSNSVTDCEGWAQTGVAMNALIAICSIIGGIAAIWGSAIACKAACCCAPPPPQSGGMVHMIQNVNRPPITTSDYRY